MKGNERLQRRTCLEYESCFRCRSELKSLDRWECRVRTLEGFAECGYGLRLITQIEIEFGQFWHCHKCIDEAVAESRSGLGLGIIKQLNFKSSARSQDANAPWGCLTYKSFDTTNGAVLRAWSVFSSGTHLPSESLSLVKRSGMHSWRRCLLTRERFLMFLGQFQPSPGSFWISSRMSKMQS